VGSSKQLRRRRHQEPTPSVARHQRSCYPIISPAMVSRISRAVALSALSFAGLASAFLNYSTPDMMRAQMALMDDRPKDCPPW